MLPLYCMYGLVNIVCPVSSSQLTYVPCYVIPRLFCPSTLLSLSDTHVSPHLNLSTFCYSFFFCIGILRCAISTASITKPKNEKTDFGENEKTPTINVKVPSSLKVDYKRLPRIGVDRKKARKTVRRYV